jgi:predicted metal-dependent enzyme (double-stranded beta helix superfamily)
MFYLVDDLGDCQPLAVVTDKVYSHSYRLYRFLTELEDVLAEVEDDRQRLRIICPMVVRLLQSSPWLQLPDLEPDPQLGWAVQTLYEEPFFPLTVQMVAWRAGSVSPIHNHGAWGLVAMVQGQELNTFWQREPSAQYPDRIVKRSVQTISEGEIISFLPNAIHQVEVTGDGTAVSFNLYGETKYHQRWEFDPLRQTATLF